MPTTPDTYDAVIVGAGLAGALMAHHLAEAAHNVVVLEAREMPGGGARRGAGLALLGTPEPYAKLTARLGADTGRDIWNLTHKNIDLLAAILERLGQEAKQVGSLRITENDDDLMEASVVSLKQDLFRADVKSADAYGYPQGLQTQDDMAFDPVALVNALLDHPNISVEYETEVQAIKANDAMQTEQTLAIWARKRYLWGKNVILTGGAHAVRLHPGLRKTLRPLVMHTVDLRHEAPLPTPLVLANGQVVVQSHPGGWRMVGWSAPDQDILPMLTEVATHLCPEAPVYARHSWWIAQSQDKLPIVGELPNMPHVFTVSGLGPWGLSWAFVAADLLVSHIIHGESIGILDSGRLPDA